MIEIPEAVKELMSKQEYNYCVGYFDDLSSKGPSLVLDDIVDAKSDPATIKDMLIDLYINPQPFLTEELASIEKDIRSDKYAIIVHRAQGEIPSYAYTVGLTDYLGYEITVSGRSEAMLGEMLNAFSAAALDAKKQLDGKELDNVLSLVNTAVKRKFRTTYRFGELTKEMALSRLHHVYYRYGDDIKNVASIVFPDRKGKLPGDKGYDKSFKQLYVS